MWAMSRGESKGGIMADQCVVVVYDNLEQAQNAVHILDRGGFPAAQVSW